MSRSPTALSLDLLRRQGHLADVAEKWVPGVNIRRDLFGAFDLVAVHPDRHGVLGVQCTSGDHHASRRTKLLANPAVRTWLQAGNAAEVWSWQQVGGKWTCRREAITLDTEGLTTTALTPRRRPRRRRKGERQGGLFDALEV